jgi:hypothetical protein
MAAVSLALTGTIAALMGGSGWSVGDQLMLLGIGAAMAGLLVRYAAIRAVATHEDLTVRNLFLTRTIAWSEIESMRFAHGDPWVYAALSDGDTLGIMAIQRADGDWGREEARRLAALVTQHRGPSSGDLGEPGA